MSVYGPPHFNRNAQQVVGMASISQPQIGALQIPLPPLAEQEQIVAEVERRLSVIERAEATVTVDLQRAARLRQSILQQAFSGKLVTEAAVESVKSKPAILALDRAKRHFRRAVLSAEIVHRLHAEPTFGRTKHQKVFHLCEHIAQIEEIEGQYHREAAGPLDNKLIYANEAELKKQQWFETVKRQPFGHAYRPMGKAGSHRTYLERYWPDKLDTIAKLIDLLRTWNTESCEIFSTVYAAWNDLILWGREATDDAILHQILNCWHESKQQISRKRWLNAIARMRKMGYVPTGFGKPTAEPA
jgi:type I restriction enzyme S subunit